MKYITRVRFRLELGSFLSLTMILHLEDTLLDFFWFLWLFYILKVFFQKKWKFFIFFIIFFWKDSPPRNWLKQSNLDCIFGSNLNFDHIYIEKISLEWKVWFSSFFQEFVKKNEKNEILIELVMKKEGGNGKNRWTILGYMFQECWSVFGTLHESWKHRYFLNFSGFIWQDLFPSFCLFV